MAKDLTKVLKECSDCARIGYKIALEKSRKVQKIVNHAQSVLEETEAKIKKSHISDESIRKALIQQTKINIEEFGQLVTTIQNDLNDKVRKLNKFSITLFGRTMAGKSTLMTVLTHGDGMAIGKGAQRTTRDVRTYEWNGLSITDVPGIAAFEGKEDEEVAYNSAKDADLVLFLLTDDAPQQAEAECFAKIRNLGKAVIVVLNMKRGLSNKKPLEITQMEIQKSFDVARIKEIEKTFKAYAGNYGQNWDNIEFIPVHMQAAYYGSDNRWGENTNLLYKLSRITTLENKIMEIVSREGKYLRIKTFVDSVNVPVTKAMNILLESSLNNSVVGRNLIKARTELGEWGPVLRKSAEERIKNEADLLRRDMRQKVDYHVSTHYNNDNIQKLWEESIKNLDLDARINRCLNDLNSKVNDKVYAVYDIANQNIKANFREIIKSHIKPESTTDWKNWGRGIIAVANGGAFWYFHPVGWALAGMVVAFMAIEGIWSWLTDDKLTRIHKAQEKLKKQLEESVNVNVEKFSKTITDYFYTKIYEYFKQCKSSLQDGISAVLDLADTQKSLAWEMNVLLESGNKAILQEICNNVDPQWTDIICSRTTIARIPGEYTVLMVEREVVIPQYITLAIKASLKEDFRIVESGPVQTVIRRIVKLATKSKNVNVSLEPKIQIAHISIGDETIEKNGEILNRIKLAEQLTKHIIMM